MIDDPHFGFILAAYLAGVVVFSSLLLWIILDYKKQKQLLATLEASGARRRLESNKR